MAFPSNLIRLGIVLTMAAIVSAKLGLHPNMTVDRMKALWQNEEELASAKDCFRGTGPCSPDVESLKDLTLEVYRTLCVACDARERQVYRIGFRNSLERDPPYFRFLIDSLDPGHTFIEIFKKFMLADD